jgi:SAM-dependent methyltransferase
MPDPVPPLDSSRRARWDERHAAQDPIESAEPDPTLIDEIGSLSPRRALDLGAGDGRNAVWLASRGWDVTAVDFSQVALDRGRARAAASGVHVEWELADFLEWTPGGRSYDLVTLFFIHLRATSDATCTRGRPLPWRPGARCSSSGTTGPTSRMGSAAPRIPTC